MNAMMLPLALLAAMQTPTANRQIGRMDVVRALSCPLADSLLGSDWDKGDVTAWREDDGTAYVLSLTGGTVRTTIQMSVTISYRDTIAPQDPHGNLHMIVFDDRRLAEALMRPDTTSLTLLLDDSLSINLGSPIEGEVRGALRTSFLPINVALPRSAFLSLARARKGRAQIAGKTFPIGRQLLKEISRTYRAVVCMPPASFPLRKPSPGG